MKDMPAANEVHEAIEEGVTAILGRPDPGSSPTRTTTSPASSSSGWPSAPRTRLVGAAPSPAPGTEFTIPCDRVLLAIGQGPELDWIGPGSSGPKATKNNRLQADAVTFETARPGVFGTGDVRIGAATVVQAIAEGRRAAYAVDAFLRGNDLASIRTRQTLAEPQPEFLSIVPFTSEVKEPRYRMKALEAEERNRNYVEYELPYREEVVARSTRCLQCTCEAIGYCDLRRLGIEYGTNAPDAGAAAPRGRRPAIGQREPLHRREPRLHPRRQPRSSSRAVALHRLRPLRGLRGGRRRGLLRLHAHRLRHPRDDAARHEPERHALRVLRALCRDVPDRRADAQAARPQVRGRREPLHPVRDLRRRLPYDALRDGQGSSCPASRADDRPHGDGPGRPRDRGHVHPRRERDWPGDGRGAASSSPTACSDPAGLADAARRRLRKWQRQRHGRDHGGHGAGPTPTARTPT